MEEIRRQARLELAINRPAPVPGRVLDLTGEAPQAEVCRAVLCSDPSSEDLPHPDLNDVDDQLGTVLHWAAMHRLADTALVLVACRHFVLLDDRRGIDGSTALHVAAAEGLADVVEELLAHPDFTAVGCADRDGFTALHGAAYGGHDRCVRLLLADPRFGDAVSAVGAVDVARPPGHWTVDAAADYDLRTALHMAAARGQAGICEAILAHAPAGSPGAEATNRSGATALHIAARRGFTAACRAILDHDEFVSVNVCDARGFTALHWAAEQASGDICAALLARKDFTAVEAKDLRGRTAMEMARDKGYHEVHRLILQRLGTVALSNAVA